MTPVRPLTICFISSCLLLYASLAHADVEIYTLENVLLADGEQITGTFVWTYDPEDFEGGTGEFAALEIPHTTYSFADGNLNIDIQSGSIEITGNGDFHDQGLDITMVLSEPLSLTQPAPMDLDLSFFECCGNGFNDQPFQSGDVSPMFLCPDVRVFQARCNVAGTLQMRVIFSDASHSGETVTFEVDGVPVVKTINGRAANHQVPSAGAGPHTVELLDPPSCKPAKALVCTAL